MNSVALTLLEEIYGSESEQYLIICDRYVRYKEDTMELEKACPSFMAIGDTFPFLLEELIAFSKIDKPQTYFEKKMTIGDECQYFDIKFSKMQDYSHKFFGTVVMIHDATERKVLAAQLHEAMKMEAIGTLSGGIAHEFNNLLAVIMGNIEFLLDDATGENATILTEVEKSAKHGANLVKQLLTFNRKVETNFQAVDINLKITRVKRMLEKVLPRMISIKLDLANNLPFINGDSGQIEQILLNLALNARDAMPDGGTIILKTEPCLHKDRSHVLISFSDTGSGISSEHIQRIFDPFFSTKGVGKGTGLGLSVTYGLIASHGGEIYCDSVIDKGTIFKIYLPVTEIINRNDGHKILTPLLSTGNETILLVDDENAILQITQKMLHDAGYKTIIANNGEDALAIYQERAESIHMVMLDLSMPGMGGEKCMKKLIEFNPNVKIIIASGYVDHELIETILSNGAKRYLMKPFSKSQLLEIVRNVLDEKIT